MKVAQKPRGTASFRRYELVSVCSAMRYTVQGYAQLPLAQVAKEGV
jgi:hypothetical protein